MAEGKWIQDGYDNRRGAYLLGYYERGVRKFLMLGYPDYGTNRFKVYPYVLDWARTFPKISYVNFEDVKK